MSNNLSRRDMLKGTAAGAVGLAAGLAPAATLASAPSQDAIQIRWSQNEDALDAGRRQLQRDSRYAGGD